MFKPEIGKHYCLHRMNGTRIIFQNISGHEGDSQFFCKVRVIESDAAYPRKGELTDWKPNKVHINELLAEKRLFSMPHLDIKSDFDNE